MKKKTVSGMMLALFLLFLSVFANISQGNANGWVYKKRHVIIGSSSGAQNDYQIRLIVHYGSGIDLGEDIYLNSKCRGDFGDIRFTDLSGNELDYWIEESTDFSMAKIWVKIPNIPAYPNTTEIYIHYGNPFASTTSNGQNTFLLFDDFDDDSFNTTLWEDISQASGSVSEIDGVLILDSQPGWETDTGIRSLTSYTGESSVHVKWRVTTQCSEGGASIIRIADRIYPEEIGRFYTPPEGGFEFLWLPYQEDNVMFYEWDNNRNLASSFDWFTTLTTDRWYNFQLKVLKNSSKVIVDGIEKMNLSDTGDYSDNETLEVGMRANGWAGGTIPMITEYDWIFLRKLSDPEPTHGATYVVPKVVTATVDINPNTFNLKSQGQWITAYIQLPEGYNAEDIDATTILLNETIQPVLDPKYDFVTNSSEYLVDHNEDGILERMVKFHRAEVKAIVNVGNVTLTITGEVNGISFEGSDTITVIDE